MKDYEYCKYLAKKNRHFPRESDEFRRCRDELEEVAEQTGDERIGKLASAFLDLALALVDLEDAQYLVNKRNRELDELLD